MHVSARGSNHSATPSDVVPIIVVGANGLIGRAVMVALAEHPLYAVSAISRHDVLNVPSGVSATRCDIRDATAVRAAIQGHKVVVHCATYVGADPKYLQSINVCGTQNVIEAARSADKAHVLYLSTAGVYGTLATSGEMEGDYAVSPESALSQSRATAEDHVLEYGGSIVRPLFVTGVGDRHFLLPLAQALLRLGTWVDEGKARLSVTSAAELGRTVVDICRPLIDGQCPRVLHATSTNPSSVRSLLTPIFEGVGVRLRESVQPEQALALAASQGIPVRKFQQFTQDYFIGGTTVAQHSKHLVSATGIPVGDDLKWYVNEVRSALLASV